MQLRPLVFIGALLAALQSVALAGTAVSTPVITEKEETMFSFGLRFSFGDMAPEVVGSVRRTTTETDSDVTGIQGEVAIPLSNENSNDWKFRILGLFGDRDFLGQIGGGFNFGSGEPIVSGGVQGPNVEGGVDLQNNGANPYFGLNMFGRPSGPTTRIITPPTGW